MANKRSSPQPSGSAKARSNASAKPATPKRTAPAPTKRTNAKGGSTASKRTTPKETGRYTAPIPKYQKVSPIWVPILMFVCLIGGMAMIICNYVSLLPDSPSNGWLLGGLGLITVGFITATKYH